MNTSQVKKKTKPKKKFELTRNQEAWLKALESGKYKKACGFLARQKTENSIISYCCLGVACEVYDQLTDYKLTRQRNSDHISFNGVSGVLPDQVSKSLNFRVDATNRLIEMNDDKHFSHKRIAAIVRSNPEDYFISGK